MTQLSLAEALATRLCHDLSGVLGALGGALELAGDPDQVDEALPFAQEAAETLIRRLRLFRAAWGPAADAMTMGEVCDIATGLPLTRRVRVELGAIGRDRRFRPASARLLLNLLMLGVESLGGEGTLHLAEAPGGDVILRITGPRAAWPTGFATQLADRSAAHLAIDAASPRDLQGPLTALLAHDGELRLAVLPDDDALVPSALIAELT